MNLIHRDLTPERWFTFSVFFQLSNVSCDLERAISWKKKGDLEESKRAFERALELLTLTILDPKNRRGPRKELTRTREMLIDYFMYDNEYGSSDEVWQSYFNDFAFAAARERERRFK